MFGTGQTVVRLRPQGAVDPYAQRARALDWTKPSRADIPGSWIASSSSAATGDATRDQVITSKSLYCPPGADIRSGDRIEAGSDLYQVTARPSADTNPFTGWQPVMEVPLRLVEG